jgi:uncharacterized protein (TIGR02246 family)
VRRVSLPLMLLVVACRPATMQLTDADVAAIRAIPAAIDSAALAHDWDALLAVFTEDGIALHQGAPTVEGRAAMRAALDSQFVGVTIRKHATTVHEVAGSGTIAYARGMFDEEYAVEGVDQPMVHSGRFLAVLNKQPDGTWLVAAWATIPDLPPDSM